MAKTCGNIFYVYVLFRPWDGTPFYVGKGKRRRWLDHEREKGRGSNKHLARVIDKAARLKLEIPRVKIRENLSETEAFGIEIAFIAAIGRKKNGGPLVNATDGGDGTSGHIVPPHVIEKSSARMKEQWLNPAWRANTIANNIGNNYTLGRSLSEEHRYNISRALIGRPGICLGKNFSDEHRANIGKGLLGHRHTEETLQKMRDAWEKRGPVSDETRAKQSASAKLKPPPSAETCEKLSKTQAEFANSPEGKIAKSNAAKARWAKDKQRRLKPDQVQPNLQTGLEC